jgi:hypothetical protein
MLGVAKASIVKHLLHVRNWWQFRELHETYYETTMHGDGC